MAFDYNQLNIVGRDANSIKFIQDVLLKELDNLKADADVNGKNFKNLINVADEVWSGPDKDAFVKQIKKFAVEYTAEITTLRANIAKYFTSDVNAFNDLQKRTTNITNK